MRQDLALLARSRPGDVLMEQERELVEAIWAQPEDDGPRLAYAAWLQERGDPRGDFIEAQVRWHQARPLAQSSADGSGVRPAECLRMPPCYSTVLDSETLLDRFDRLAIWNRGDQRAPHKPLLVLYALGR
jgi:uncharacterized protein (TIGR02996 family)